MYILLVYDDIIRFLYGKYFESEGFSVDFSSNGEDAFCKIRDAPEKYDFILMDLKMDTCEWDGIMTTKEMLKINRDLSIIIFSKKDQSLDRNEEIRFKALSAGALRYEIRGEAHEILSLIHNLITEVNTLNELRNQLNKFTAKQQWLQSTLFASNIGIVIIDRTYRIYYMNQYQQNLMSETAQDARFCYQLFPGTKSAGGCCKHCPVGEIFEGQRIETTSTLFYVPIRGEWQYLQVFASPLAGNQGMAVKGNDGKPIAVVLAFRFLDAQSAGQLHYKVRLKAIMHAMWQDFDHIRLYLAAPDLNQLKIIETAGHNEDFSGIYDLSADPCGQWCLDKHQARVWDKSVDKEAMAEQFARIIGIASPGQWLDYPLFDGGKLTGWLSADNALSRAPVNPQSIACGIKFCSAEIVRIFSSPDFDQTLDTEPGDQLRYLVDIDVKLSSAARNPVEGLEIIIEEIKRICEADRAFVRYLKDDKLILGPVAGVSSFLVSKDVLLADKYSLFALAARREEPLFIPDAGKDPAFQKLKQFYQWAGNYAADIFSRVKAAIYYPVKLGTRLVGVISIHSYSQRDYSGANEKLCFFLKQINQKVALLINDYVPYLQLQNALKEAKKQHRAAEAQRQRFEKLLSAIGDEVNIINKDDIITFVNHIKKAKFQQEREDITDGKHFCWRTFEQRDRHCDRCSCTEARRKKEIVKCERHIAYDKDSRPYVVEVTASPLILPDGTVDEVIEVCRDITREERHKKELEVVDALSGSAAAGLSVDAYLARACLLIMEVIRSPVCSLFLWDPDWNKLVLKASTAVSLDFGNKAEKTEFYYQDSNSRLFANFTAGIPAKGYWEELKQGTAAEMDKFEMLYKTISSESLAHYLHVPLKTFVNDNTMESDEQKTPLGMIEVVNKVIPDRAEYCLEHYGKAFRLDPDGFTDEDIQFLEKLGDQISTWVHNQLLLSQKKMISKKMEILANTVAAIAQIKTQEQLAYLTLLAVTHNDGLANNRAFLLLPVVGEGKDYSIYAKGLKNKEEAETMWKSILPDYKTLLVDFKTTGIPAGVFWHINDFEVSGRDVENSYFLQETLKAEQKIRIFTDLHSMDTESGISIPGQRLSVFDKECLSRIGYGDEICIAVLPVAEREYGFLMVDNIFEGKRINQVSCYLLKQYAYGLAAAIQRWYATTYFKALAAQAAHEIRGALQSIMSYNALYKYYLTGNMIEKGQQQIEKEVIRASDTVTAFIEYVKAESRYWKLKKEYTSLIEIINEAVLSVEPEAAQEGIHIVLHREDGEMLMLTVDPVRMRMVFLNMLRNALKAIPKGLPQERKKIDIHCAAGAGEVVITFIDQGMGMSQEDVEKIFEPFSGKGTGLGLTLSRQIVEKHNGRIKVESRVDYGTTMFIILPKE